MILENFQIESEGNQVDYTTKPKLYNKDGKNDIRHSIRPYQEGIDLREFFFFFFFFAE
jgi:hypothetical protein